jgi:hypothetical protein
MSITRRRPSLGSVLGAVALFVALGGPAEAAKLLDGARIRKGSITAQAIRPNTLTGRLMKVGSIGGDRLAERSVGVSKLAPAAVSFLTATPQNGITGANVLDRSLSGADLGDETIGQTQIVRDGVGASEIADGAVDSGKIADGRLSVYDIASFAGSAAIDAPLLRPQDCHPFEQVARLIAPRPGATIATDAVFVSTPEGFGDQLTISARPSGSDSIRFVVCNVGLAGVDPPPVTVRYLAIAF